MALITPEEKKELLLSIEENKLLDELFDHQGMTLLLNKCKDIVAEYDRLDSIKNMDDLMFKKGQIDILNWLISYQSLVRQTLEHSLEEAEKLIKLSNKVNNKSVLDE